MRHIGGAQTDYVWDVNRGLPEILQETIGGSTTSYVYGLGRISSTDAAGTQTYYTVDGLDSTTDLTDASHSKTDGYTYDEFGAASQSPGTSGQPFQFTGQQTDADSGLRYLRTRYYDLATGRFLGRDRVPGSTTSPSTQNPYAYALNNPTTLTDPTGLCAASCEGRQRLFHTRTPFSDALASGPALQCVLHGNCRINSPTLDVLLPLLPDYLACVAFGVAAAAFVLDNPWLVAGVIAGTAAAHALNGDTREAGAGAVYESSAFGAGLLGQKLATTSAIFAESGLAEFSSFSFGSILTLYNGYGCAAQIFGVIT